MKKSNKKPSKDNAAAGAKKTTLEIAGLSGQVKQVQQPRYGLHPSCSVG